MSFWFALLFPAVKYTPRSLSLSPRWLSSSVQTLETRERYSSCVNSSAPISAILHASCFVLSSQKVNASRHIGLGQLPLLLCACFAIGLARITSSLSKYRSCPCCPYLPCDGVRIPNNTFTISTLTSPYVRFLP